MATRPLYIPLDSFPYVEEKYVEFDWHAGFSMSQKQKSIASWHYQVKALNYAENPLEVSSKSEDNTGVALSAFNLKITLASGKDIAVENIFQASKMFERGGPFKDLLAVSPLEAKRDIRLKDSGDMVGFQGKEGIWPLEPKTLFYDWVYINALHRNPHLVEKIKEYDAFTDIEFNPAKSFNCQARSVALYLAFIRLGKIEEVISSSDYYRQLMTISSDTPSSIPVQQSLI
ncbi:hypothetical protein LRP50_08390 [Enterovibrio sp. ZSDZ42]|uniref:Uncharacterized protein n=1 Tax=Enterovibrio gelatinilyticus TaxID=2899819 RepID=A0ABT5QYP4_9GAMM|nr:hypothetical protein [Enterovibrio sp. ZSDZ42]MDD1793141.1 hypothetical protein [Enterovibrio sp. ZSDZ42]